MRRPIRTLRAKRNRPAGSMKFDLIVIGAGIAGASAAEEATRRGSRVLVVDPFDAAQCAARTGAIPLATLRQLSIRQRRPGVARGSSAHFAGVIAHVLGQREERARAHADDASARLARQGAHIFCGQGDVVEPHGVRLADGTLATGEAVLLATGSAPRRPGRFPWDSGIAQDSEAVLAASELPRAALVIGAEEEGCEMAAVLAGLGVQVTLVERRRKLFRFADRDLLDHLHLGFQRLGVTIVMEDEILAIDVRGEGESLHARVSMSSGRVEVCDRIIVAAGRTPRADFADVAGLDRDVRGFVAVDENGRTSLPWLFAAGDVTGPPFRVGTAVWQGRAASANALSGATRTPGELTHCVHTHPQIATVGVGEDACRLLGRDVIVGSADERDLLVTSGTQDPVRVLKLVFDRETRVLLGVQIAGGMAVELIHVGALLVGREARIDDVADMVLDHPAQCDAFRAAAWAALARAAIAAAPAA